MCQVDKNMSAIEDDLKNDIIRGQETKSDLSKATELLFNELWKRRKTIIKQRQLLQISNIDWIGQAFDIEPLKLIYDSLTEHMTSIEGIGRQQIVDITKFSIERQDQYKKDLMETLGKK